MPHERCGDRRRRAYADRKLRRGSEGYPGPEARGARRAGSDDENGRRSRAHRRSRHGLRGPIHGYRQCRARHFAHGGPADPHAGLLGATELLIGHATVRKRLSKYPKRECGCADRRRRREHEPGAVRHPGHALGETAPSRGIHRQPVGRPDRPVLRAVDGTHRREPGRGIQDRPGRAGPLCDRKSPPGVSRAPGGALQGRDHAAQHSEIGGGPQCGAHGVDPG